MRKLFFLVLFVCLALSGCKRSDLTTEWAPPETTLTIEQTNRPLKQLRENILRITQKEMYAPDSAGGVSLDIDVLNKSEKIIKYVNFKIAFFNRVNDPVLDEVSPYDTNMANVQLIGPIKPGDTGGNDEIWECIFYNSNATRWSIEEIEIIYFDSESIVLNSGEIALID